MERPQTNLATEPHPGCAAGHPVLWRSSVHDKEKYPAQQRVHFALPSRYAVTCSICFVGQLCESRVAILADTALIMDNTLNPAVLAGRLYFVLRAS